ncbi:bifunctional folylpolyglutamate synthase/dihydrofolate synthase [Gaopeijia maritima]|uniref:Dihydrofolate synthase/folylpolyglutamate synthase n=1 Tax=Gaopeijia maritima TaxID=3119007 RepID=A0ABU9EAJ6_9BACT
MTALGGELRDAAPDRLDRPFNDPLFERLFPPLPAGVHWGLERVASALADLGHPERRAPALHVGGTNGKGSVASTCAAVLETAGRRTGLYTSPHLCSVRERFQVAGRPLSEARLVELADEIRPTVVAHGLTFFEAATVLAFHAFAAEGVEVQVIEVGLGGRLDATNVLVPAACALTNVALDHADFLGNTLEAIAREKAGIIKAGVPVVTAETAPELLAIFREVAEARGAPLTALDPAAELTEVEVERDHTAFTLDTSAWGALRLTTPLVGRHQAANAALAVQLLERLPEALRPSAEQVKSGVASVRWPGRDQIEVIDGTTWLLDVAHNVAGIQSLVTVLDRLRLPEPRVAVVGVLGDKEWRRMLPPLLRRVERAVLTQPPSAPDTRRWDPDEAMAALAGVADAGAPTSVEADFERALDRAREAAGRGTVVVTGSCHTVGDALRALGRVPFGMASS